MCNSLKEYGLYEVVTYTNIGKRFVTIVLGFDHNKKKQGTNNYYMGLSIMNPKERSANLKLGRKIARGRAEKAYLKGKSGLNFPDVAIINKHRALIEAEVSLIVDGYSNWIFVSKNIC